MDAREREREMDWGREKGRDGREKEMERGKRERERESGWGERERERSFYFTLITCVTSHQ